jgi:hypothetical protein
MLGEFKDFAMRGSMIDMAVGIIVGGFRESCKLLRLRFFDAPDWLVRRPLGFLEQIH